MVVKKVTISGFKICNWNSNKKSKTLNLYLFSQLYYSVFFILYICNRNSEWWYQSNDQDQVQENFAGWVKIIISKWKQT